MMNGQKRFVAVLVLMLATLVSCSDDGDDNPTIPATSAVSGQWAFLGQLTNDTCELTSGPFNGTFQFNQSGSTVTTPQIDLTIGGLDMYFTYQGTVTGNSVSMAAVDPYVLDNGGTVFHLGSGINIQNIQNNSGSGSFNITGQFVQGGSGSCQTVWTGTWTKQ